MIGWRAGRARIGALHASAALRALGAGEGGGGRRRPSEIRAAKTRPRSEAPARDRLASRRVSLSRRRAAAREFQVRPSQVAPLAAAVSRELAPAGLSSSIPPEFANDGAINGSVSSRGQSYQAKR
jgi:hypothetical protein